MGRKIVIFLALLVIGFSSYTIYQNFIEYWNDYKADCNIAADSDTRNGKDFEKLRKKNEDIIGWIRCDDTPIDYAIVQSHDNEEYLNLGADKKWNGGGAIFADYRTDSPFADFNTIIYGHHMADGTKFHCLEDFKDYNFAKKHKHMTVFTPRGNYDFEACAVAVMPYNNDVYNLNFADDTEKAEYLKNIEKHSIVSLSNLDINDTYLTLSTCSYEYKDARAIVVGKLTRLPDDAVYNYKPMDIGVKAVFRILFEMMKSSWNELVSAVTA